MAADPKRSEGARLERAVFMRKFRREMKQSSAVASPTSTARLLTKLIAFGQTRKKRYDRKSGGL